jgi:hypothetical protein
VRLGPTHFYGVTPFPQSGTGHTVGGARYPRYSASAGRRLRCIARPTRPTNPANVIDDLNESSTRKGMQGSMLPDISASVDECGGRSEELMMTENLDAPPDPQSKTSDPRTRKQLGARGKSIAVGILLVAFTFILPLLPIILYGRNTLCMDQARFWLGAIQTLFVGVAVYTLILGLRGRFWDKYQNLQRFVAEHPHLYFVWQSAERDCFESCGPAWYDSLSQAEQVHVLTFLEMWADAILEHWLWQRFLFRYEFGFSDTAKDIAAHVHLDVLAGYWPDSCRKIGFQPTDMASIRHLGGTSNRG